VHDPRLAALNKLQYSVWISRGAGLCLGIDGLFIILPREPPLFSVCVESGADRDEVNSLAQLDSIRSTLVRLVDPARRKRLVSSSIRLFDSLLDRRTHYRSL